MYRSLSNILLNRLKRAFASIDESLKSDISVYLESFWKSVEAKDLYYASFGALIAKALGQDLEYPESVDIEKLDFVHKCAYARILFLQGIRNEALLADISKYEEESVYDIFLKLGVMSDYGIDIKFDSYLNRLKYFRKFGGGFSNIIKGDFSSNNASAAGLCIAYLLSKKEPKKSVDFLLSSQDESGGYFAQEDSQIPDLLTTATSVFSLSLYNHNPRVNPLEFIEAHCLEDGTFSATIKDDRGDIEYTFYGLLAIGSFFSE